MSIFWGSNIVRMRFATCCFPIRSLKKIMRFIKRLKIRERRVKVKDFLIWKSKKIIKEQKADVADKQFSLLEKEILSLSNKSEPKSGTYKKIAQSIIKGIDSKACNKLLRRDQKVSRPI